ncbi:hypothetical protein ACEPPN_001038 [Leptodophora sp. 'Broadleaf-Isolate-01']
MYDASGRRKTNKELYGSDPLLHHHLQLAYRFIAEQDGIPILFGRVVLDWFVAEFDAQYVDGCYVFVVNGFERIAYHLDHPEYSIRWATEDRLRATASVLENISARHGIPTQPAQRCSTSNTKRDWVRGDDRMTQIAHRDRQVNASRRGQAQRDWWSTVTKEQIDDIVARRSATWANTPQTIKDAVSAKKSSAWFAKSHEERAAINAQRSLTMLGRSKEEIEASNLKQYMTRNAFSAEKKEEIIAKIATTRAATWAAKPAHEKEALHQSQRETRAAFSTEKKEEIIAKIATTRAATMAAKPAHEKEAAKVAWLAAFDANRAAKSQEAKNAQNTKRLKTIAAKSDSERKHTLDQIASTKAARSPRAKAASKEKQSQNFQENRRRKANGEALLTKKEMKTMSWKIVE